MTSVFAADLLLHDAGAEMVVEPGACEKPRPRAARLGHTRSARRVTARSLSQSSQVTFSKALYP